MNAEYEKPSSDFHCRNDGGGTTALEYRAHLHYNLEILYMEDGDVTVNIDSNSYYVKKDDLLIIFPNCIHRFQRSETVQKYKLFKINPDLAPDLLPSFRENAPVSPIICNVTEQKRLCGLIEALFELGEMAHPMKDVVLKGYVTAFFGEILAMLTLTEKNPYDGQAMRVVLDFCSKNFTRDLTLSALEKELHLSRYYISHLFGEKLGVRFNDYINSLRVSEACRQLKNDGLSITEVAMAAGFGTLRTFNRVFARQIGVTPSEYRRNSVGDTDRETALP